LYLPPKKDEQLTVLLSNNLLLIPDLEKQDMEKQDMEKQEKAFCLVHTFNMAMGENISPATKFLHTFKK
jgi:hypothetical protein